MRERLDRSSSRRRARPGRRAGPATSSCTGTATNAAGAGCSGGPVRSIGTASGSARVASPARASPASSSGLAPAARSRRSAPSRQRSRRNARDHEQALPRSQLSVPGLHRVPRAGQRRIRRARSGSRHRQRSPRDRGRQVLRDRLVGRLGRFRLRGSRPITTLTRFRNATDSQRFAKASSSALKNARRARTEVSTTVRTSSPAAPLSPSRCRRVGEFDREGEDAQADRACRDRLERLTSATTSAPSHASARYSAGVSKDGPATAARTPAWPTGRPRGRLLGERERVAIM